MKREEIVEAMARAIRVEMGPVFGTPEYLARPGNVERLEARQQSAADKWAEAALTALEARGLAVVPVVATEAARDVLAERAAQITREGWTPEHDDEHDRGQLALAASVYAADASGAPQARWTDNRGWNLWPWEPRDFKNEDGPRRSLVKAAALLIAEIERLDRTAMLTASKDDPNV